MPKMVAPKLPLMKRTMLKMPSATPNCSLATTKVTAAATGDWFSPIPKPNAARLITICQGEVVARHEIKLIPAKATTPIPRKQDNLLPHLSAKRPARGATRAAVVARGKMSKPA